MESNIKNPLNEDLETNKINLLSKYIFFIIFKNNFEKLIIKMINAK